MKSIIQDIGRIQVSIRVKILDPIQALPRCKICRSQQSVLEMNRRTFPQAGIKACFAHLIFGNDPKSSWYDMCLTKKLKTRFLFGLAIPATLPELSSLSTRYTESMNFQSVKISPITHWPRWDVEMFHLISSAGLWETSRFTYGRWTGLLPILAGFEKIWNGGNHWRWIIRDTSIHLFWPRSKGQTAESLKEWAMETFLRIQCSQTILHTKYTSRYFQCFLILKVLKTVEKIHRELDIPMGVYHWGLELGSCLCCHGTVGDDFALGPSGQSKGRVFEIYFQIFKTRGGKRWV